STKTPHNSGEESKPSNALQTTVNVNTGESGSGSVSVTIPITVEVKVGTPIAGSASGQAVIGSADVDPVRVEEAVRRYWKSRPKDVVAARVGFFDEDGTIGDRPCIAVSVAPKQLAAVEAAGPKTFEGVPVQYFPADASEQIAAMPELESVDSI